MTVFRKLPSIGYLASILSADPDTGELTWLVDKGVNAAAGDPAGTSVQAPYGYRVIVLDGVMYKVHRICWALYHDQDPYGFEVCHKNGNRADNRQDNLEIVKPENRRLMTTTARTDSRSGAAGVTYDSKSGKWRARLRFKGKSYSLGLFKMREEAAARVDEKRRQLIRSSKSKQK